MRNPNRQGLQATQISKLATDGTTPHTSLVEVASVVYESNAARLQAGKGVYLCDNGTKRSFKLNYTNRHLRDAFSRHLRDGCTVVLNATVIPKKANLE